VADLNVDMRGHIEEGRANPTPKSNKLLDLPTEWATCPAWQIPKLWDLPIAEKSKNFLDLIRKVSEFDPDGKFSFKV
jgi:hypothetical protein